MGCVVWCGVVWCGVVQPKIGVVVPAPPARGRDKHKATATPTRQRKQVADSPLVKQVKIKLKAAAYTHKGMDFAKLFSYYDRDNSGSLEFPEFVSAIRRDAKISPAEVSDEALQEVFDAVDDDGGGEVDIDEFVAWLNSKTSGLVVKKKKKKKRRVVKRKKVRVARVWIVCVVFMFVFVLFCLVLFCFVLFCFVLLSCSVNHAAHGECPRPRRPRV